MKLEINYKKKTGKITNTLRLDNELLNNQGVNKEIKGEMKKKTLKQMKMELHIKIYV